MLRPRRVSIQIEYAGKDISDAVSEGLLSFVFVDNLDEADEIRIEVEDIDGNWAGPWYPKVAARRE